MSELYLQGMKRNARLRAWRSYGVPLTGGWQHDEPSVLLLGCSVCGFEKKRELPSDASGERLQRLMRLSELGAVRTLMIEGIARSACPHLAPLLGGDPPEVRAIHELELLASE
jgi:hypothetical protein